MSSSGSKRGLELLIRKRGAEGAGGFEIKVYRSDRAFLRLRPVQRAGLPMEIRRLDEVTGVVYVVHLPTLDRHVRLTRAELDVFSRMDGQHTVQDLAAQLVFAHGRFDFDEIRRTLGKLRGAGMVEVHRPQALRTRVLPGGDRVQSLARRLATYDRRWEEVDPLFARLYRWLRPLFSRWALPLEVLLALVGAGLYLALRWTGGLPGHGLPLWAWALLFLALTPAMMTLHELAHGVATKAHGRRVRAVGLTLLDGVVPSLYVDVTDMYMSTRRGRIVVALAGPLANAVLAAVFTLASLLAGEGILGGLLVVLADVNLALALFTAWPFHPLPEDGYEALSEGWRLTLLRERAWDWLRSRLGGAEPTLEIPSPTVQLWLAGTVLSGLLVVLAVVAWVLQAA